MESNKVKLPKEVAEAIDHSKYMGIHNILESVINMGEVTTPQLLTIRNHFKRGWLLFAEALVNGYEVEQTPEDEVIKLYNNMFVDSQLCVRRILDLLNIKISGVND